MKKLFKKRKGLIDPVSLAVIIGLLVFAGVGAAVGIGMATIGMCVPKGTFFSMSGFNGNTNH